MANEDWLDKAVAGLQKPQAASQPVDGSQLMSVDPGMSQGPVHSGMLGDVNLEASEELHKRLNALPEEDRRRALGQVRPSPAKRPVGKEILYDQFAVQGWWTWQPSANSHR